MGDKGGKTPAAQVLHVFRGGEGAAPAGYLPKQGFPEEARRIFGELARKGAEDSAKRQKIL